MHFEPLAFPQGCSTPDPRLAPDASVNRLYAYGVVARLALLAAAHEIAEAKGSRDKGQGAGENG
jgi:glutamate--cysteine ligase